MSASRTKPEPDTLASCAQGSVVMLADATASGGTDFGGTLSKGTICRVSWQGQHSTFVEIRHGQSWGKPTPVSPRTRIARVVEEFTRTTAAGGDDEVVDPLLRGVVSDEPALFGTKEPA